MAVQDFEMGLEVMKILFPPSRPNSKAIYRLGFVEDGQLVVDGEAFMRFRLRAEGGIL